MRAIKILTAIYILMSVIVIDLFGFDMMIYLNFLNL